ncbi:MAG: hypothetical protein A2041_07085 [Bacteroidetes bacterium GWA2_31_9b]|nr:MAG: hypothetical protein A2041_07085 [Bacteroidetes bacterium GWA2_31_9b]
MQEPLEFLFDKHGIDLQNIKHIVCGEKYVAVILKNGNIGVCATLNNFVNIEIRDMRFPDLKNLQHRIVLNAYYNALFNYENSYDTTVDIFEKINFSQYKNIVMIGFFRSLSEKFRNEGIQLTIFDKSDQDSILTDMNEQIVKVSQADAIIITSTSVFNNTFIELVNATKDNCDIFTLGPSTIMSNEMFNYRNVKLLFGSIFEPNDILTLKIIQGGGGTKQFMPYMKKVFLQNK